jgi:hypothetical protein
MAVLSLTKTRVLLAKHLPRPFVNKFIEDRTSGFLHCRVVAKIERELLTFGPHNFLENKRPALQWATMLQNVTNFEGRTTYNKLFGKYEVSERSLSPILADLDDESACRVLYEAEAFNSALGGPHGKLRPFHNLTAALFAYNVLQEELGVANAVMAAQAILFHHETNVDLIPDIPVVRLLRDAAKLENLGKWSLTENIANNVDNLNRPFFNFDIPLELRIELLEGHSIPEKQAYENSELTFDAFQFALKFLFHDTNPNSFALPNMVGPYLRKHQLFVNFTDVAIDAAQRYNKTTELQIMNLDTIKELMQLAVQNTKYAKMVDLIGIGSAAVDKSLNFILNGIDDSLKIYSHNGFASYARLLALKALALEALGRHEEAEVVMAHANLRNGINSINGN